VADALLNRIGAPPWILDYVVLGHARPKLLRTYTPTLPLGEARDALDSSLQVTSGERQRYPQRLVKSTKACRLEAGKVIREQWLGDADEAVAVHARLVLQPFFGADVDLRRQPIAATVDGCADHGREP
jgi:hypothetical protein